MKAPLIITICPVCLGEGVDVYDRLCDRCGGARRLCKHGTLNDLLAEIDAVRAIRVLRTTLRLLPPPAEAKSNVIPFRRRTHG